MWLSMAPQIYSTVLQLCLRPDFFQGLLHRVPGPSYRLVFSPLPLLERIRLCHSPLSLLHMGAPEGCGEGAGMLALGGRPFCGCHLCPRQCFLLLMETLGSSASPSLSRMWPIPDARNFKDTG